MAFLLKNTSLSQLSLQPQKTAVDDAFTLSRRGIHVELGAREKANEAWEQNWGVDIVLFRLDITVFTWVNTAIDAHRGGFEKEIANLKILLLAPDPSLKRFKSHKKSVWRLKKFGDVLTIVVVAGCCYEIYVKAVMRQESRKQAKESV